MTQTKPSGPRNIALVGPYTSGKTTLLESILSVTGRVSRKGSVNEGNTVGDSSAEARDRSMSVEVNVATTDHMGDEFTFLDCPGSIEFLQETYNALIGVDAAVVVCEPDVNKVLPLAPLLKFLDDEDIPHFLFVNKIDKAAGRMRDLLDSLQSVSSKPLVLRQIPIRDGEEITGYVDLASERAFVYKDGAPSEIIDLPGNLEDRKSEARYEMLEKLADFDDKLMEELLEDVEPERGEVFEDLGKELQDGVIVPVLLGSADSDHGVRRLLKALRWEAPASARAAARVGVEEAGEPLAQILKTYVTPRGGKISLARVWRGTIKDGMTLNGERVSGVFQMLGQQTEKLSEATAGQVVGLGRLEEAKTGDTLSEGKESEALKKAPVIPPVFSLTITAANRNDEVKLSGALSKLQDEDPSLIVDHNQDTQEMILWGQGDIHLKVAFDRLQNKYGIEVNSTPPQVPYKEAIRKPTSQHGRFKRQSGGHGQFGDVHIEIAPLPRGSGFEFHDKIVGGAIPRQYIPAVEAGVKEYLSKGPLGFPVVDVSVTLTDGQYHSVDSSEQAFKTAGRIAMSEGLPNCNPVLLEPVYQVEIHVPSEFTSKINNLISVRRGQILGFEARDGWLGWDTVSAHMPQSELHDLVVELRSITHGVGSYEFRYDHLQELTGRLADQVLQASAAE
jgi:elongation factor G